MNSVQKYIASYDLSGNLLYETDTVTGKTTRYYSNEYGYSGIVFVFNASGNIVYETLSSSDATFEDETDALGRSVKNTLKTSEAAIFIKNFTFITDSNNKSSYQVSSESFSNGSTEKNISYNYTYDALGNLTNVSESGIIKVRYQYDALSQLVREDNAYAGKSYTYTYDGNGNITSKKTYAYTTGTLGSVQDTVTYGYGNSDWKDLMTSYDGVTISYDASGNPLNWANTDAEFSWTGRQLDSITYPDGSGWSFKYNASGLRTHKEFSNGYEIVTSVDYTWFDGQLAKEYRTGSGLSSPITIEYYYDGTDLIGFSYNGTDYYYGKTNLGEIRYIYNASGTIVTTYLYDAWGAPISITGSLASTVGEINPFRYKHYYYDSDTELYYLKSRYYDSEVGRFLNADALIDRMAIYGVNMFTYCRDNPINYVDIYGLSPIAFYIAYNGLGGGVWDYCDMPQVILPVTDYRDPINSPNYKPPKKGERRIKIPNGKGYGWRDAEGNIWVWTPDMHGGEGWTVQYPSGGHRHEYPNGHVRESQIKYQLQPPSIPQMITGAILILVAVGSDFVGFVADDGLVITGAACFVSTEVPYSYCEVCNYEK